MWNVRRGKVAFGAAAALLGTMAFTTSAMAAPQAAQCSGLPSHAQLRTALQGVVTTGGNSGLGLNMWATVVNRDGIVCAVVFTGTARGDQWPGSRVISAQKANTTNAFSLPDLALSTANLFSAVQPGGSLFGLQASNPVDTETAYGGNSANNGQANDPMVGQKIGGVNVFGGGLPLYNANGALVGGLGTSGDTSCTDHIIAWKVRHALNLDSVPNGVSTTGDDNMIRDTSTDGNTGHTTSPSGFGHPGCIGGATADTIIANLPTTHPVGPTP